MNAKVKSREIKLLGLSIGDIANILVAFTAISALLFSAYQYKDGLKIEAKIDRPIITIPQTGIGYDSSNLGNEINLASIMENFGSRPAYDLTIKSVTLQKDKSSSFFKIISDTLLREVNPMVPGIEFYLNRRPTVYQDNTDYYFKISFSYKDVISGIYYSDSLYYKWNYINFKYSISNPQQIGLEKKEAELVDSFLKSSHFIYQK